MNYPPAAKRHYFISRSVLLPRAGAIPEKPSSRCGFYGKIALHFREYAVVPFFSVV